VKGIIVLPAFYKKRHATNHLSMVSKVLFDRICKDYNFSIVYSDSPDLKGFDVAMVYASHRFPRMKIPSSIFAAKGVKIIYYYGDLPCYGNKSCENNHRLMIEKSDLVIGTFYDYFLKKYPKYARKYVHFPGCFYPYESYANLTLNFDPKMKCLLSGHTTHQYYPFRAYIARIVKNHTGNAQEVIIVKGRNEARFSECPSFLNQYFCAIATSGVHSCIVGKYFEIPATGALLLAKRERELDMLGFKPNVHYIPITRRNVVTKVQKVLNDPEKYAEMRHRAMEFVRKNHSDINRSAQFGDILKRVMK